MTLSPFAGKPAPAELLVDIPRLVTAYYTGQPDASISTQRVAFGTSGHRGSSFDLSFNEWHVLAISQAICLYREAQGIDGPLFVGIDTHALSTPAGASALEVLAANGVTVMIAEGDEYTPTPAISHAILCYNRGRTSGCRRYRHHAVPQPAAKRWLQIQPDQWRPGRYPHHQVDRSQGQRAAGQQAGRRQAHQLRTGAQGQHHPSP
jgi:hypothetical protein